MKAATKAVQSEFNIMSANCADAVESGLKAGGLNTGYVLMRNSSYFSVEDPVSLLTGTFVGTNGNSNNTTPCLIYKSLAPNDRYDNIKNNNLGSIIKLKEEE